MSPTSDDPAMKQPGPETGDGLDDLAAAFRLAEPRPDPALRAAHLAAAARNFADLAAARQGSPDGARPNPRSRPVVGWLDRGVSAVIRSLSPLKAGLVASTALVAVGIVAFVPETRTLFTPPGGSLLEQPVSGRAAGGAPAARPGAEAEAVAASENADSAGAAGAAGAAEVAAPAEAASAPAADAAPAPAADAASARKANETARIRAVPAAPPSYMPAPVIESRPAVLPDSEEFANADASPVKIVAEEPVSTFSVDVDTASWSVLRSSLMRGQLPPADSVRVEEMVNYFPYSYAAPEGEHPFRPTVTLMDTPWNPDTRLVHIGLQGALPAVENRPPLNLVFLVDTSGSMGAQDKLPLLVQSFRLMLDELRPDDQVAIVTYAGQAGVALAPVAASERGSIIAALDALQAGGSTAGQAGLEQAYALAEKMHGAGEVSRILLATDGDFNVGIQNPDALKDFIAARRDKGIYLSVLGFGRGNLDDATMQALAQNGNGTASYIDTLSEARKVLVDELTGALFPIADDVKVQVEFNPAVISEYRLIGYETRALRREDFSNDKVDAGEIGAGMQVTAIYELTPVGSPAVLNGDLRYGAAPAAGGQTDELGFLRLRYKAPGEASSQLIEMPIPAEATPGGEDQRFAAAIAGFGQLLRGSVYLKDWGYADAIALAGGARGADPFGYRSEAVQLMRLAESLSRN